MLKKYKAHTGKCLPLRVSKKLVMINDHEESEFEMDTLDYVTKSHIKRAVLDKDIYEVTEKEPAPKKAKGDK